MIGSLASPEVEAIGGSAASGVGIATCDTADGLTAITRPEMELVIWRRSLPSQLQSWLEGLDASALPDLRGLVRPSELPRLVEPELDESGVPEGDMRDLFLRDIQDLVAAFARITGSALVDVRLEPVSDDACWKFHRDCVEARLLTTYRGLATEWVQPGHAEQALQEQKSYKGPLQQLQVLDVAIFKGSCAGTGSGIVHRSPPIAGTGATRLLLVLNQPTGASPAH